MGLGKRLPAGLVRLARNGSGAAGSHLALPERESLLPEGSQQMATAEPREGVPCLEPAKPDALLSFVFLFV